MQALPYVEPLPERPTGGGDIPPPMTDRTSKGNRRGGSGTARNGRGQLPRYDQALLAAKNAHRRVRFLLSVPASFTDDEGEFSGMIVEVDKYQVKIAHDDAACGAIWVNKLYIVATVIA